MDQAMRPQCIGAQFDLFESIVDTVGATGLANPAEQRLDRRPAAELAFEERQIGFAFRRRIRVEEKGQPALLTGEVGNLVAHEGDRCLEAAGADEAPRTDNVGYDFDGQHAVHDSVCQPAQPVYSENPQGIPSPQESVT